jgi:hypothetical protein
MTHIPSDTETAMARILCFLLNKLTAVPVPAMIQFYEDLLRRAEEAKTEIHPAITDTLKLLQSLHLEKDGTLNLLTSEWEAWLEQHTNGALYVETLADESAMILRVIKGPQADAVHTLLQMPTVGGKHGAN